VTSPNYNSLSHISSQVARFCYNIFVSCSSKRSNYHQWRHNSQEWISY